MDLYTTRPPAAAEDFIEETRNVELPGTHGRDGLPLVVRIRRLPAAMIYMLKEDPPTGGDAFADRMSTYREWAAAALVEPRFSFNGDGDPPQWDRLPIAAQMAVAGAIATFTTDGMEEVTARVAAFRGGEPNGGAIGRAGGGFGDVGIDAPGEPAAPPNGLEAAPGGGASVRPKRARRRAQAPGL